MSDGLTLNLTEIQRKFLLDDHRFIVIPAGRRSGKSMISKIKVFSKAIEFPNTRYFHAAPTRQQAKLIFWKDLKTYTKNLTKYISETELYVQLYNGSEIHVIGLDKAERIEGQVWHGVHITEIADCKETVWPENIRPLLADTRGFAILDGVPAGRNHYYDLALYACDKVLPPTIPGGIYKASVSDPEWCYISWFSADILNQDEIEAAKRQLDTRTFKQEYEGSFEGYEGLAYVEFGEHNYMNCEFNQERQVSVGMDFNIDPMTATLGHIIGDEYFQFDEIYMRNSTTLEMCEVLKSRFNIKQIVIYPDSTGKAESSNASRSDIDTLRRAGYEVRAKDKNPRIIDRVNTMNSFIREIKGKTRFHINPEKCKKTINDFNKVERLKDGRLNKDQEKQGLKHITDALGYLVYYNWPIRDVSFHVMGN